MMSRTLMAAAILVAGVSGTFAQVTDRAEVIRYGIIEAKVSKVVEDKSISAGQRSNYEEGKITKETNRIKPEKDLIFGVEIKMHGRPEGRQVRVRVVWLYPEPGLKNPNTGRLTLRDEFESTQKVGTTQIYQWTLGDEWTQVPGTWTVQLWKDDRRLAQQSFEMLEP
jgi:hypothetical protein